MAINTFAVKAHSRTPSVTESPHANRQENAEIVAAHMDDESQSREEKFRNDCLQRDGRQCAVSGVMDIDEWKKRNCPEDVIASDLEGAHIIPYAYGSWRGKQVEALSVSILQLSS
jgi:hypothetical protein